MRVFESESVKWVLTEEALLVKVTSSMCCVRRAVRSSTSGCTCCELPSMRSGKDDGTLGGIATSTGRCV
jgi:hypothetical protein